MSKEKLLFRAKKDKREMKGKKLRHVIPFWKGGKNCSSILTTLEGKS
jgi:hypothetical protein